MHAAYVFGISSCPVVSDRTKGLDLQDLEGIEGSEKHCYMSSIHANSPGPVAGEIMLLASWTFSNTFWLRLVDLFSSQIIQEPELFPAFG